MARPDGRKPDELRPLSIERGYTESAPGSVLIRAGRTVVLCTACFEKSVPKWREGSGSGWVTAEYDMLPGATNTRRSRNRGKIDGRTQEIQRLIGRSLRSVVAMDKLGENSILLDCDVLQADGGTRTASVTGAFVALSDCVRYARRQKLLSDSPILEHVAAVSVGIVDGRAVLDLDYVEDSAADVDMNVVMTGANRFVEVQGTGEGATFDERQLSRMVKLAARGVRSLIKAQEKALRKRVV